MTIHNKSHKQYYQLCYDKRLGLNLPNLECEYEDMPKKVQAEFELACQKIASQIPERIKLLEAQYMERYFRLQEVVDLEGFDRLLEEMNDLSSRICDLNLLYRTIEGEYLGANVHG